MNYLRINPGESFITEEDRIQFIAENFNGSDLLRITIALFFIRQRQTAWKWYALPSTAI